MAKLTRQVNPRLRVTMMLGIVTLTVAASASAQEADGEEAPVPAAAPATEEAAPTEASASTPAPAAEEATPSAETDEPAATDSETATSEEEAFLRGADTDEAATEAAEEPAAGEDGEEAEEEERFPRDHFGHRMQGGVGISVGSGYQFEIAYGGDYCDRWDEETEQPKPADEQEDSICSHRSPIFMDFQLSFGVTEGLELLVEYRLGLTEEPYLLNNRPMVFGFGVRYFVSPLSRVKFSIGVVVDIDITPNVATDVAVRPIFGLQIEIVRWVAFFVQGSVNLNFIRSFGISLDGTGGFQFRFP